MFPLSPGRVLLHDGAKKEIKHLSTIEMNTKTEEEKTKRGEKEIIKHMLLIFLI